MTSDDKAASLPNETALSFLLILQKKALQRPATKPELQLRLGEDGDEWEGVYEEGDWEEF